jgi:low affinity Fe/Cu permease
MNGLFTRAASFIATAAGQPVTFLLAVGIVIVWAVTGPLFHYSDTWQLVINTGTTIVTFLMVFLIQNSQNRDGAAMQAKLDEILRAVADARSEFIGIEHLDDTHIEQIRTALEQEVGVCNDEKAAMVEDSVDQLLKRRGTEGPAAAAEAATRPPPSSRADRPRASRSRQETQS